MNRHRWLRATVASLAATLLLALGVAGPARADQFYLGDENGDVRNGKYFFNLHYRASVQGYPTGPDDDLMEIFLGTTHRIKCDKKWSFSCQMA